MAGQISLCQGAFAAIGAFTVFQLVQRYQVPVLVAGLVGAVVAAAVGGAALAARIRRLGGVWIAIATLAFAYFFDAVIVRLPFVGGGNTSLLSGTGVPRPVIGPWDLGNDKSFLVLALVVSGRRRARRAPARGRAPSAAPSWPSGAARWRQSIGISPARARSRPSPSRAFIAGLGGALLAMHQQNVNYGTNFAPFAALFWLVLVVTLGVTLGRGRRSPPRMSFSLFDALLLKGAIIGWVLAEPGAHPEPLPHLGQVAVRAVRDGRHPVRPPPRRHPRAPPAAPGGPRRSGRGSAGGADVGRRPSRRTAGGSGGPRERVLRATRRHQAVRRHPRRRRRQRRRRRRRAGRADRAERRGQDHPFQLHPRSDRADGGTIELEGVDVSRTATHQRARLGIGRTFQRIELFPGMTVRDHLLRRRTGPPRRRTAVEGPAREGAPAGRGGGPLR